MNRSSVRFRQAARQHGAAFDGRNPAERVLRRRASSPLLSRGECVCELMPVVVADDEPADGLGDLDDGELLVGLEDDRGEYISSGTGPQEREQHGTRCLHNPSEALVP